jgi:hypothetical protein
MKKKILFGVMIMILILNPKCFAQQQSFINYSFNDNTVLKSATSGLIINTVIGKPVIGVAKSSRSVIRGSSTLCLTSSNKNTVELKEDITIPNSFSLEQNYPNPFNPATQIKFSVPQEGFINLSIYNLLGEKVKELVSERKSPGTYTVVWNAKDYTSGMYIYNLRSGSYSFTRKLILLK